MTIQTQVIRAERHDDVGSLIEENAEQLIELWCERALAEEPTAKRVHADVLRDHLATFVRAIGRALQAADGGAGRHQRRAIEHGEQRWEAGWSLTEVVSDYQLLRIVVLEFLERTLARPLACRESIAISVFIDDAIAASIRSYVSQREEDAVRAEKEKAQALEELNRRKDEFMAMLGHELRNPLAPIQNSVMVLRAVLKAAPEAALTSIDMIDRQTRHLVRLVDDLLDLAKIARGELSIRMTRVDLARVIQQAAETIAPVMKSRNHDLTVELPSTPLEVDGDPDRLLQIVCNLLNNAARYTPEGGRIELEGEREGTTAVIRVRDNGIGIPADMRSRVFEMFTQLEAAKHFGHGGLGLGLTLVQRLVQQHGGSVVCNSAGSGPGSEFVVALPLAADAARSDCKPPLRIVKLESPDPAAKQ